MEIHAENVPIFCIKLRVILNNSRCSIQHVIIAGCVISHNRYENNSMSVKLYSALVAEKIEM